MTDRFELAPVRPGEDLVWDRVAGYLRAELGVVGDVVVRQFPNGSANLTYLVTIGEARLVVRRPPFGQLAPGAHDMRREFKALSRLYEAYDRAPRALLLCDDHAVAGADLLVVEYREGVVVWDALPSSMAGLPDAARRIGFAVVDALADLHAVDPDACGLGDLGRPDGYLRRQVAGWQRRWSLVAPEDGDGSVDALGAALSRSLPPSPRPAIVHHDFKLDNCQFAPGEPDRVRSVFDWDMTSLGDPLVDLGTMLNYWPDPADPPGTATAVPGQEHLGLPTREEVVDRYRSRSDVDVDGIDWYVAFGCWKTAVVLRQLYARHLRGETSDARMADRGGQVSGLAERGLGLLERAAL
jgi:aminoglycoside phosphotransferase (APT) family kinase protein